MAAAHIAVGASDDLDAFHAWMEEHDSAPWPVPKAAQVGDRVLFLIPFLTGEIVASGIVQGEPSPSERWKPKYQAEIGNIHFRANPIPIELLRQRMPDWRYLTYDRGYTTVPSQFLGPLEELLRVDRPFDVEAGVLPEELNPALEYWEGAVREVSVNAYERNPDARRACIAHYGATCSVCGIDFAATYGPVAEGFIHVHHLLPLAEIAEEYEVDPIADLRPVCPNCHAVIHRRIPSYSIEEVRAFLTQQRDQPGREPAGVPPERSGSDVGPLPSGP